MNISNSTGHSMLSVVEKLCGEFWDGAGMELNVQ